MFLNRKPLFLWVVAVAVVHTWFSLQYGFVVMFSWLLVNYLTTITTVVLFHWLWFICNAKVGSKTRHQSTNTMLSTINDNQFGSNISLPAT